MYSRLQGFSLTTTMSSRYNRCWTLAHFPLCLLSRTPAASSVLSLLYPSLHLYFPFSPPLCSTFSFMLSLHPKVHSVFNLIGIFGSYEVSDTAERMDLPQWSLSCQVSINTTCTRRGRSAGAAHSAQTRTTITSLMHFYVLLISNIILQHVIHF